jgi:hypothetical protein
MQTRGHTKKFEKSLFYRLNDSFVWVMRLRLKIEQIEKLENETYFSISVVMSIVNGVNQFWMVEMIV